jgi:hypothetical protein
MKHCILILLILTSCSPIKRHSRLVRKYPFVHTTDSVTLIDTIQLTTDKVVSDTIVHESLLFDTVIVTKDNLTVKVVKIRDSVYINGECDTIFIDKVIERKIPVKYYETKKFNWWIIGFIVLVGCNCLMVLYLR